VPHLEIKSSMQQNMVESMFVSMEMEKKKSKE